MNISKQAAREDVSVGKDSSPARHIQSSQKKKNVLGLDFEIPDELSQLIANEIKSKKGSGLTRIVSKAYQATPNTAAKRVEANSSHLSSTVRGPSSVRSSQP